MVELFDYKNILNSYSQFQNSDFLNRYIEFKRLEDYLRKEIFHVFDHEIIGFSELGNPIYSITLGEGSKKILIWSQMHGNESTTTKSLLDLLNLFRNTSSSSKAEDILNACKINIILMLNPDGANEYSRFNANEMDLNRDAVNRHQKETKAFFQYLENFKPDYCFNMHGQRTIFSVGNTDKPATLSFLAPSFDKELNINKSRRKAIKLIVAAEKMLSEFIPGQIGKYDDTYNPNCFGDQIQKMGIPTVLYEAGHYPNDYNRNMTRKFVTLSLLKMLEVIVYSNSKMYKTREYFNIPNNQKNHMDIIVKNVSNSNTGYIGIQYNEILKDNKVVFQPYIKSLDNLSLFYAHRYIDAISKPVIINGHLNFEVGLSIDKIDTADIRLNLL